jgi:putative ABC transport system permease protein
MFQDLKYALRLWAKRPLQAAFAIAALAIGIGANTGVFSVVDAWLLRSLPFHEADRLALLQQFIPPHDSAREFHDWRHHSSYLADAALFEENDANLGGLRLASRVHVAQTSRNFFSVLGIQPVLGRSFTADDDVDGTGWGTPGRNSVVVIGYGLWQQLFGGDAKILGATIRIDGNPLTIVGVAPPGFDFPGKSALWKPGAFSPGNNGWATVARLKPGISWPQARAAFALEVAQLSQAGKFNTFNLHPQMTLLRDGLAGPVRNASLTFLGAVVFVLLIACANVANLLTASTADRVGELSVRYALGASRARLARQILIECLLLSCVSMLAGLLIAYWTVSFAANALPALPETHAYSILNPRVLIFTLLVSLATALIFGVLPLLYAGRISAYNSLRSSTPIRGSHLLREGLCGLQVMLTIILLAGSMSLGQAFIRLMKADRGYAVNGIATINVSLDGTTHQLAKRQLPYFEDTLGRIRRLPGVRSASATEFLPLYASAFVGGPFGLDGRAAPRSSTMIPVLSEYFQTMGADILYGREFTEAEVRSGARVAVVNEQFANQFGTSRDVLGHRLTNDEDAWEIVGVVRGMEYETDPTIANGNQVFIPSENPGSFFSTFVVRVDGRAEDRLATIRDTIQSVDPQVPIFGAETMEQRLNEVFARPQFYRTAISAFAVFALLLAAIGTYGIVAYTVAQRTQEMGVRIALGTTPVQLRGKLLREQLLTVAAAAVPGLAGAQLTGHFLGALIYGAKSPDVLRSATLVLFLALVASASIWSATRRIQNLDVISLLRSE